MAGNNTIPDWAPRRPMVVMDRNKMSQYWRAAAIRGGITNSAGALQGLGDIDVSFDAGGIADRNSTASGDSKLPGSTQSVDSFLSRLSETVQSLVAQVPGLSVTSNPVTQKPQVPWWQVAAVGVVAVVAGRWAWKKMK